MLWSLPSMALTQSEDSSASPTEKGEGARPPGGSAPGLTDWDGDHISDDLQAKLAGLGSGEQLDVVVTFSGPGTAASAQQAVGGFVVHDVFGIISGFSATMSAGQVRALARQPGVFRIEHNFTLTTQLNYATRDFGITPNPLVDPADPTAIGARANFGVTGAGVGVCFIDSGIDVGHERHLGKVPVDGWIDLVGGQPNPYDDHVAGHGTHVASIAGGQVVNWNGGGIDPNLDPYEGVAPDVTIYAAKVIDAAGNGLESDVITAIGWCVSKPNVAIINISLGDVLLLCGDGSNAASQAANAAVGNGVTVVVAAGNFGDGTCTISAPGDALDVITVGALAEYSGAPGDVNASQGIHAAWFSSVGPTGDNRFKPDVMAPGMSVMAAKAGAADDYHSLSGTSMATPFVAGVAALMIEANRNAVIANPLGVTPVAPVDIKAILTCTARDYHLPRQDNVFGWGAVDGYAAVQMAAGWNGVCDPTAVDPINLPNSVHLSVFVEDNSEWTYTFEVTAADLGSPIAATITTTNQVFICDLFVSGSCWSGHMSPDLDAELRFVRGVDSRVLLDQGTCMGDADGKCGQAGLTETLNFRPSTETMPGAGTYEIQVHGSNDWLNLGDGGSFTLDLSFGLWAGAVSGGGGGGGGGTSPDPSLTLSASGYKAKGIHKVDLNWSGATNVDKTVYVYRDGVNIATVNGGGTFYPDDTNNKGGATYMHQVCEANMTNCSNVTTTVF
jgi:serine protease AprX